MNTIKSLFFYIILLSSLFFLGCAQQTIQQASKIPSSIFAQNNEYVGSPYPDIAHSGLFATQYNTNNQIAILNNGDDSFAARIQALKNADTSIRIQALIFTADESGLYITELLKQKKQAGLDVRIIVDAFSNPKLQTQKMFFDLKQHGIEVEGYEAMLLQWVNEIPIPFLMPHAELHRLNKRFHEKMWLIDGETDHAVAVVGGLNIANEYFRVDPNNADFFWRDQDVIVKGSLINDMVSAFDRNFDYFIQIKESRGIFNTNKYWEQTRNILDTTGKVHFTFKTDADLDKKVRKMAEKPLSLNYHSIAKSRFFQNRPRYKETYINQAYLTLIHNAKEEILIANAYFVPSEEFLVTIKEAAQRCVRIRLLTNSTKTNDLPAITMVGRESYQELLMLNDTIKNQHCVKNKTEKGIEIWEWQGKLKGEKTRSQGTMHSKYAIFDQNISLVGSYNLDTRSETLNSESALVFENKALAQTLAQLFYNNDLSFSHKISMTQAEEYLHPSDPLYKLQKNLGDWFKDEL